MIPMASGATEPYYSVSVFTYLAPDQRRTMCSAWLARAMNRLFGARLHWGKHFPWARWRSRAYPELRFQTCRGVDPNGVFRNDYTKRVLGLSCPEPEVRSAMPRVRLRTSVSKGRWTPWNC